MQQIPLLSAADPDPNDGTQSTVELPGAGTRHPKQVTLWLQQQLGRPVELVFTRNRSTMLSMREQGGAIQLRLHQEFLNAPQPVWLALAAYLDNDSPQGGELLDQFISTIAERQQPGPVMLRPRGRFHNLQDIFNQLNATFFHNGCSAQITWGRASRRRYRRSIQLGSFVANENLIRVHLNLDRLFVPRFYVEWVVFHEMLHEVYGTERRGRRRVVHPPEFAALEESFPDFLRCKQWEEKNIHRLLK